MKTYLKNFSNRLALIVIFLSISFAIGNVTRAGMAWYQTLIKSPLTPPPYIFPITWSILYIMLALACANIFMAKNKSHKILFSAYMILNWSWSFVFFLWHFVQGGFWVIVFSDLILLALIVKSWRNKEKFTTALFFPTLIWGTFAAYLNWYIWVMN